ncbi:MAG: hypothetical protein JXQ73_14140 [Phycisphaerae bacterium]|nr:hypothetical protein [Phycisphaerae bacterium]
MIPVQTSHWLNWVGPAAAALGAVLVMMGMWPRRRGTTPYCRACGYDLTSIDSGRCPECGIPLTAKIVVRGVRRRKRGLIAVGGAFFVLALASVGWRFRGTDWYRFRPTAWVIGDLRSGDWEIVGKALKEFRQRIASDSLSASQVARLMDVCLREQVAEPPSPIVGQLMDLVERCRLRGVLSETQQAQYLRQMVDLRLLVRPRVALGDPVPYRVEYEPRVSYPLASSLTCSQVLLDGKPAASPGWASVDLLRRSERHAGFFPFGSGDEQQLKALLPVATPGVHQLALVMRVRIGRPSPRAAPTHCQWFHEADVALTETFEVVSANPQTCIRLIKDDALRASLQSYLTPCVFKHGVGSDCEVRGYIDADPLPVNVAFEVFVRSGGKEHSVGHVAVSRDGGASSKSPIAGRVGTALPSRCDIILRSSAEVARQSLDLFEIWRGELVYENVPFEDPWRIPGVLYQLE